jgi:tetratricopeptide (TPR) repeat protein
LPLVRGSGSDDEWYTAVTNVANACSALDRHDEATRWYDEAIEISRRSGVPPRIASALVNRGDMATIAQRYEEAIGFLTEALAYAKEHGVRGAVAVASIVLANSSFMLGRVDDAERYAREATTSSEFQDIPTIALLVLAGVTERRGDLLGAARLLGASEGLRAHVGYEWEPAERAVVATVREELAGALETPEVQAAYDEGRALEPEDARALLTR